LETSDSSSKNAVKQFVRPYNETLTVAAMRVRNEDRSSARIHCCDAAPAPTGFAEIVNRMQSPTQSATRNSTAAHMTLSFAFTMKRATWSRRTSHPAIKSDS